jgi:hypothetical protein
VEISGVEQDVSTYGVIGLPDMVTEDTLEDLVSALFAASGWYVSPNVKHHGEEANEVLEIDVVATKRTSRDERRRVVVEAKSGTTWGVSELFKLLGRMTFLEESEGYFFACEGNDKATPDIRNGFARKGCHFVLTGCTPAEVHGAFVREGLGKPGLREVQFWYHAFRLRREVIRLPTAKDQKKLTPAICEAIAVLREQKRFIDDGIFQHATPLERLKALLADYQDRRHQKLAAQVAEVLDAQRPKKDETHLRAALYGKGDPLVYTAMFLDTRARLATLNAVIDYLLEEHGAKSATDQVEALLGLKQSAAGAMGHLSTCSDIHLYPVIWQRYVYEYGGFFIDDLRDTEIADLASTTGAAPGSVKTALGVWEILFPMPGNSWKAPQFGLELLKMLPAPIQGLGAMKRSVTHGLVVDERCYFTKLTDQATANFLKARQNIMFFRVMGKECPDDELTPAAAWEEETD